MTTQTEYVLRLVLKDLKKRLGTRITAGIMGDELFSSDPTEYIPSSSTLLNLAIGGGAAVGRVMEVYGDVQTGKTLLELDFLAQNQKRGGYSYYLDAEFGTSKDFAKRLCGIRDEELGHIEVKTQEDCWIAVDSIIQKTRDRNQKNTIVIGLDSLAALPPLAEKLQSFDEEIAMGLAQRIIRKALRKLVGEISTENVAFIFTNHEIFRMQTMPFAEKTISWGGTGPKYFASTRIKLITTKRNKEAGEIQSLTCRATIVKNRFNPPGQEVEYFINVRGPHLGIDDHASIVEFLYAKGAFGSKKGWVDFEGRQMRKHMLIEESWSNPEVYEALKAKTKLIFEQNVELIPSEDEEGVVDGVG